MFKIPKLSKAFRKSFHGSPAPPGLGSLRGWGAGSTQHLYSGYSGYSGCKDKLNKEFETNKKIRNSL